MNQGELSTHTANEDQPRSVHSILSDTSPEAIVAAVDYARGMNGRAPSASLAAQLVATYEAHGSAGVLAELLASDAYRSRVVG